MNKNSITLLLIVSLLSVLIVFGCSRGGNVDVNQVESVWLCSSQSTEETGVGIEREYDARGNIIKVTQKTGGKDWNHEFVVELTNDERGYLVHGDSHSYSDGEFERTDGFECTHDFDQNGRVARLSEDKAVKYAGSNEFVDDGGSVNIYSYHSNGSLREYVYSYWNEGGTGGAVVSYDEYGWPISDERTRDDSTVTRTYTFFGSDPLRPSSVEVHKVGDEIERFTLEYDIHGNLVSKTGSDGEKTIFTWVEFKNPSEAVLNTTNRNRNADLI